MYLFSFLDVMGISKELDKIYKDISGPGSYRSVRDLYLTAKLSGVKGVTYKKVTDYLKSQKGYTIHHRVRKKFPREKTVSYGFLDLIQVIFLFLL